MLKNTLYALMIAAMPLYGTAQKQDKAPDGWHHLDPKKDGIMGVSSTRAYQELLQGMKASPVTVAVIDGGIEFDHDDLKKVMWINTKDSTRTGTDEDGNGYVNDKFGWNFIGNANGENVQYDNLEVTRLVRLLEPRYVSVLPSTPMSAEERREFQRYQQKVTAYAEKLEQARGGQFTYHAIKKATENIVSSIGKEKPTLHDFKRYKTKDRIEKFALKAIRSELKKEPDFDKFMKDLDEAITYFDSQILYHLNKTYDPRPLVGDHYENSRERYYGNADVKGPDAEHGTHVAGIIAAERNNGIGIDGIADHVKIMALRVVPDGDERDKDVANAIRYAVDQGAKIINMSFGKGFSSDKAIVDEAVRYAMDKDVLLVHAAGNDGKNIDDTPNFPNKQFIDSVGANAGVAENWITVGASDWKQGRDLVATFSNYGKRTVDVFAPGVDIYSTIPDSDYKALEGTSMAAPVVAGIAALIRSYYPQLSAAETREVIMKSAIPYTGKVRVTGADGRKTRVRMSDISVTGGVANAYEALILAGKTASGNR